MASISVLPRPPRISDTASPIRPARVRSIVSRISADGSVTNVLLTRTDVDGFYSGDIGTGTNIYIFAGDRLLRSGTVTNASPVKIVLGN